MTEGELPPVIEENAELSSDLLLDNEIVDSHYCYYYNSNHYPGLWI